MGSIHLTLMRYTMILLLVLAWNAAAAQSMPFSEREISFHNNTVELKGTLMLPVTKGRHPAVVFLHGSGPSTREGARAYAKEFAKLGLASLFFDKRGTGSSTGSWVKSSLDDLAGDALAAVAYLKTQKAVDPKRIGFWGVSQAGWVATHAAAQSEDVAFMILISGGGASPRESETFSYQQAFQQAGFSEVEKSAGAAVLDTYFQYLSSGEGRAELAARLKELETNQDSQLSMLAERLSRILPSNENRPNWSWVATYDPAPDIKKLTFPILLMFGDRDTEHPTAVAVKRWRENLASVGNNDATLMIFSGAGHGIRMDGGKHSMTAPFADGYMEVMIGWLWLHVVQMKK